jgi:hypothetical protein
LGSLYEDGRGVPKDQVRAISLYEKACHNGEAAACQRLRERALAVEDAACKAGDAGVCSTLGDTYKLGLIATSEMAAVERDADLAKRYYKRAIAIWESGCTRGDMNACSDIEHTYSLKLDDSRGASAVWGGPCKAGSHQACQSAARWKDAMKNNGAFGVTTLGRVGYDSLLGFGASAGLVFGPHYEYHGSSCAGFSFPYVGGSGLLLQGALGDRAWKASAGYGQMGRVVPFILSGFALKASVLGEWGDSSRGVSGATYVGGEADLTFLVNLSVGVFQKLGSQPDTRFTWGISTGF